MLDPAFTFKILTIGESGVGKTCILRRFVENQFVSNHLATIGIDFKSKIINVNNQPVKLKIWDTAGQERFRNITNQYYKGADGIILVFDVNDQYSYDKISQWMTQINTNTTVNEIGFVLLGNKIDVEGRVISNEMGSSLASELGIKYFETSAFNGQNIKESFKYLSEDIIQKKNLTIGNKEDNKNSVLLNDDCSDFKEKKKKGCCS